ncbi:hypothetical protein Q5H93_14380 [Hymenobacter sp. ASUV-10]|uniref:Uncharacterized protein n=1 Tax=Hymenobacter aranciens TaxID=3063996 RepID=A0ABT9BCJ9_9BACT|nr:hypothetical protein [Hymenobacter sp. ASUV-10]MDO7875927.1 hypothetical protein [Hymenobacter sp. ASUV-10]
MLNFYLIADEQPFTGSLKQVVYAGGIEEEEFELAQRVGLIETHADYYGKFRWSSKQVSNKLALLINCPFRSDSILNGLLARAEATGVGLMAFGD